MSNLEKAALAYARRGWPVFPCRVDKTPYVEHGVLDATTDEAIIADWWKRWPGANVALAVGDAGMLVLDYDPGSSEAEVEDALGGAPPITRLSARTPRGGRHDYYLLPRGAEPVASSSGRFAKNVDVRSFHGYVLLPPSCTAAGAYEWTEEGKPATASEALLAACRAARDKDPQRDEWLIEADLPENVERAVAWLQGKARLAIEGSGGDNITYATAAMLKSFGISEARALEILWEHWNPRCLPPWAHEELAVKATNAYGYNTSPPGNVTPAYHAAKIALQFKPVVEALGEGRQAEAGRFRFVDRAGVETIKPPKWLLEDFMVEGGYGLLVGPRSSYKTFAALDAALTVATGGRLPWEDGDWEGLWESPERPGAVLYVAGEGRPGLRQRVRAWEKHHRGEEMAVDIVLGDPVPRVMDGADALRQFIEGALRLREGGYRLVIFDTVGRAMQGVNENAQEHASAFTALVEHTQRELGAAVLALHHTGHESKERGRGSSVFEADCDTIVVLSRPDEGKRYVRLTMTKQKDAQEWAADKWAKAETVRLGSSEESLVLVRAERVDATSAEAALAGRRQLVLSLVDERVMEVLRANPMVEMTNSALSKRAAAWRPEGGETLGVGDQVLRKTWLPRLRSEPCASRQYYDANKDKWRYQP